MTKTQEKDMTIQAIHYISQSNFKLKIFYLVNFLFFLFWIYLAFDVYSREDWLLENSLVLIFIGPMFVYFLKNVITLNSYLHLIIFLVFHCIGAHFTYSLVPYQNWFEALFQLNINEFLSWERNNYDRMIHFFWGLFLFSPLLEILRHHFKIFGFKIYLMTFLFLIASSSIYELIEWAAAVIFGGDLGVAYVGAQGDAWDSQKDQALDMLGAFIMFLFYCLKLILKRKKSQPVSK